MNAINSVVTRESIAHLLLFSSIERKSKRELQVSLRGTMTGGYLDPKKIKLDIYNNIREQKKQKEQLDVRK